MSTPLVSVIIAGWNAQTTIGRAVRSALDQTCAEIEVLVIDDGSADATASLARTAGAGDRRLRVMAFDRNRGVGAARNAGLACATGRWVTPLDADDWMRPDRLERLLDAAQTFDADVTLDDLLLEPEGGATALHTVLGLDPAAPAQRLSLETFARRNAFGCGARALGFLKPLIRRDRLEAAGVVYSEALRVGEDYLLVADLLAHGARALLTPACGYVYVKRAGSASGLMRVGDYEALLEADAAYRRRHAGRLTAADLEALDERARSYRRALTVAEAGELVRAGRRLEALLTLARRPTAALYAREAAMKRLGLMPRGAHSRSPPRPPRWW